MKRAAFCPLRRATPRARCRAVLSLTVLVCAAYGCREAPHGGPPPPSRRGSSTSWQAVDASRPNGKATRGVTTATKTPASGDGGAMMRLAAEERTWTFQDATFGRIDVVVVLPDRRSDEKFPVLIALHGRGEAMKGPERGARGWVDDYALRRAMQRLGEPPLTAVDFEGFVTESRLRSINQALDKTAFGGLIVLCPYTPDMLAGDKPFERAMPYARFLTETLLPRARRELPSLPHATATGIDGVSLGGRVGFLAGLYAPEAFHTVAGLQAAFDSRDAGQLGDLGQRAIARNPHLLFRLLTSDRDYFVDANQAIALEYERRGLPVQLRVVPGPHDYVFNRGPGALEMLFFHDRALRQAGFPP